MNLQPEVDYVRLTNIIEATVKEVIKPALPQYIEEEVRKEVFSEVKYRLPQEVDRYFNKVSKTFYFWKWRVVIWRR